MDEYEVSTKAAATRDARSATPTESDRRGEYQERPQSLGDDRRTDHDVGSARCRPVLEVDIRHLNLLLILLLSCQDQPQQPPCTPEDIVRGPWAVGYHSTRAEVRWETTSLGCGGIRIRRKSGGDWLAQVGSTQTPLSRRLSLTEGVPGRPDQAGTSILHRVELQNLMPGTCYQYQVSQTESVTIGRFCTAPRLESRETIRFGVLGNTHPHRGVDLALYDRLAAWSPSIILHTGNIQHYEGLAETWSDWFARTKPLLQSAAILPVIGNRDLEVVEETVVEDGSPPLEFQEYFQTIWGENGHTGIGNNYAYRIGGLLVLALDSEGNDRNMWDDATQQWLIELLSTAEADPTYRFAVVIFHRALYTRSLHGGQDALRSEFVNLVAPFRVRLILNGQSHCYERFIESERTWVVSGGGGASLHDCDERFDQLELAQQAAESVHHWIGFTLTASGLTGEVFDTDDRLIDRFEIGG